MSDIELIDHSLQNISLVILLASHFPLENSAMCERRLWEDTRWSGRWSGPDSIHSPTTFQSLFFSLSFGGMLRLPLSFTLLLMASTLTYVVAQKPGSFVDGGDTLVSAMMVSVYYFLENTRRVC